MAPPIGVEEGKYSANQVFDVQRNPATPVAGQTFTASSFNYPYRTVPSASRYTLGTGEYISFFIDDNTDGNPGGCNVGMRLHAPDGTFEVFHAGGKISGLGADPIDNGQNPENGCK